MKTADAILCADLHLREDTPVCRTDDFWTAQKNKLRQIRSLQKKHANAPVLCSGDIFHKWKPSPRLLSMALECLPGNMLTIPGNHDLPAHNLKRLEESGLFVLNAAEFVGIAYENITHEDFLDDFGFYVHGFPFGTEFQSMQRDRKPHVALVHYFTYKGRKPFPGQYDGVATVMNKLKGYDLILCGDNHQPFTHEKDGTLFVNPGSLTRQTADQIKHRPRVYLWYAPENRVEPVYLDIDRLAVSRAHIDVDQARDERIEAFVNRLDGEFEAGLSFERNLKQYMTTNRVPKSVRSAVMEACE